MKRPSSLIALAAVAAFTLAAPNAAADPAAIVIANQMKDASGVVTNATLAFESSSAKRGLYCAWGPSDCGADPALWPNFGRVKTVDSDATTASVSMPEGWTKETLAARWFLFDEATPPCYDYRVEYIESDGNQMIYPDATTKTGTKFSADFAPLDTSAKYLFGYYNANFKDRSFSLSASTSKLALRYGNTSATEFSGAIGRCVVSNTATALFVDGVKAGGDEASAVTVSSITLSGLFAMRNGNDSPWTTRIGGINLASVRLYAFTLENDGMIDRDFRPAVKDGEPGLWDAQNDTFYWNVRGTSDKTQYETVRVTERVEGASRIPFAAGARIDAAAEIGARTLDAASEALETDPVLDPIAITEKLKASSGVVTNVALAFEASASARGLYRVCGAEDCGGNPASWPVFERVRTIAANATTASVAMPDGWGSAVLAARWFLFDEATPPCYDYRVEYIESDGTQMIYPDATTKTGTKFAADFAPLDTSAKYLFGYYNANNKAYSFALSASTSKLAWRYGTSATEFSGAIGRCVVSNTATALFVDGVKAGGDEASAVTVTSSVLAGLFARRSGNISPWTTRIGGSDLASVRLYAFTLENDGMIDRDLRPAVKDGEPGLWDAQNDTFYWNVRGTSDKTQYETVRVTERVEGASRIPFAAGARIDAAGEVGERLAVAATKTVAFSSPATVLSIR